MLLEESAGSTAPVKVAEPFFPVFPEFRDASYARVGPVVTTSRRGWDSRAIPRVVPRDRGHRLRNSSSTVIPACRRMALKVPFARTR